MSTMSSLPAVMLPPPPLQSIGTATLMQAAATPSTPTTGTSTHIIAASEKNPTKTRKRPTTTTVTTSTPRNKCAPAKLADWEKARVTWIDTELRELVKALQTEKLDRLRRTLEDVIDGAFNVRCIHIYNTNMFVQIATKQLCLSRATLLTIRTPHPLRAHQCKISSRGNCLEGVCRLSRRPRRRSRHCPGSLHTREEICS